MTGKENSEKDEIISALHELTDAEETLLDYANVAVKESVEGFVNSKIGKLFGLSFAYTKALQRLDVQTKDELERKIKNNFRHHDVREVYEHWHEKELKWDAFLRAIDENLDILGSQPLTLGQQAPVEEPLINARTGETTCIKDFLKPSLSQDEIVTEQPLLMSYPQSTGSFPSSAVLVLMRHFA